MPDIAGWGAPTPRSDVVLIDTNYWRLSVLFPARAGNNLVPLRWAPDSRSFVMFWSDGPEGHGYYSVKLDKSPPTQYPRVGELSPDLQKIAILQSSYIWIQDLQGNALHEIQVPLDGEWTIGDWSPDMKWLALTFRESGTDNIQNIYLLEIDSGSFIQFTHDGSFFKDSPAFAPNGRLLAYHTLRRGTDGEIHQIVVSRLDGSCQWTIPMDSIYYYTWSPDMKRMFMTGPDGVYVAILETLFGKTFANGTNCP